MTLNNILLGINTFGDRIRWRYEDNSYGTPGGGQVPDADVRVHRTDKQPARVAREAAVGECALCARETPHAPAHLHVHDARLERLE